MIDKNETDLSHCATSLYVAQYMHAWEAAVTFSLTGTII